MASPIQGGDKFGRLTVQMRVGAASNGDLLWQCRCECGREKIARATNLRIGHARSCGCLSVENRRGKGLKHGMVGTRTYHSWAAMLQRCTNPQTPAYRWYGRRGITVCERWRLFVNFLADMGESPPGLSIDRIDNDGNYEPGNCRWIGPRDQAWNKRGRLKLITHAGETKSISSWASEAGVSQTALAKRLRRGQSLTEAIGSIRDRQLAVARQGQEMPGDDGADADQDLEGPAADGVQSLLQLDAAGVLGELVLDEAQPSALLADVGVHLLQEELQFGAHGPN